MHGFSKLFGPKPINPADYDLRHFRWMEWSDAWDGKSEPEHGEHHRVFYYSGEKVLAISTDYMSGEVVETTRCGNEMFVFLEKMSTTYLAIAKTAFALGLYSPGMKGNKLCTQTDKATKEALQRHRQYQQLQEVLAGRGWCVGFVPLEEDKDLFMVEFLPLE